MGLFSDTYIGEYGKHKISILGKSGLRASFELRIDGKLIDSGKTYLSNSTVALELHGLIQEKLTVLPKVSLGFFTKDKSVVVKIERRQFEGLIPTLFVNNVQIPLKKC